VLSDDAGIVNHSTYGGGSIRPTSTPSPRGVEVHVLLFLPVVRAVAVSAAVGRYPFRSGHFSNACDKFPTPDTG